MNKAKLIEQMSKLSKLPKASCKKAHVDTRFQSPISDQASAFYKNNYILTNVLA